MADQVLNQSAIGMGGPSETTIDGDKVYTSNGVTVAYAPTLHDVLVDQYGTTVVDRVTTGVAVTITGDFLFPDQDNAEKFVNWSKNSGTLKSQVDVVAPAGDILGDNTFEIKTTPYINGALSPDHAIIAPRCGKLIAGDIAIAADGGRMVSFQANVFPDMATRLLFRIGTKADA